MDLHLFVNWGVPLAVAGVLAAAFASQRLSLISTAVALKHLRQGALIVDVRSAEEFCGHHLPGALNIPLHTLRETAPRRFEDKAQVLLLYCLCGGRSRIAKHQLKSLGYPNVFSLGSFARARQIVSGCVKGGF